MIVEEIRVSNWRIYRGDYAFTFKEGINLVVGPNGSGKSTLFEVLWRSFFNRYNTSSAEIQEIRPVGTSLTPKSSVVFRHNGKRYMIEKQFLDHQYAKLYEWDNGSFMLLHEQDRADAAISGMLDGTLMGRGSSEPKNRGIAEALWYLQKDPPLPEKMWNEGLQRGFGGIIDIAVESPEERRILELINKDYSENLTESKGDAKKNTELYNIEEDLSKIKNELSELRSKLQNADLLRERLEQLTLEETQKKIELEEVKSEKKKVDEQIKEAQAFEMKVTSTKSEYDKSMRILQDLNDRINRIKERNKEISELREKVKKLSYKFSDLQSDSNIANSEREKFDAMLQSELRPQLNKVESELEVLETLEKLKSLYKEEKTLKNVQDELKNKENELSEKKRLFDEFIAPSDDELKEFRKLSDELVIVKSKLATNSIKVSFQMEEGFSVIPDRELPKDNDEFIVTDSSIFTIKNVGKVKIRGGGESLAELNARKDKLEKSYSDTLRKYAVEDEKGLNKLLAQKDSLTKDVNKINYELSKLRNEHPDIESELTKVRSDITTTKRKIEGLSTLDSGSEDISNKIEFLRNERNKLKREIDEVQNKEKLASRKYEKAILKQNEIKSEIDGASARITTLEDENAKEITLFGSMHGLEDAIQKANETNQKNKKELDQMNSLYEEKVNAPKRREETVDRALEQINDRLGQLGKEIAVLKSQIDQVAADGLYTRLGDLEVETERLESRKTILERRADARRLIRELIGKLKTQRAISIGMPIRQYLDPWLKDLTGGGFSSLSINEALQPDSAVLNDGTNRISLESLSYGTAEQVVVLTRLAMAVILSQKEKNLVVLDDRLVNADPIRLKRMLSIIDEVSRKCQIIISSCEDTRYLGVATNIIRLPILENKTGL